MIYWYDYVDFILSSVSLIDYMNWFLNVEPVLHTCNKSWLVIVYSSFSHCCIWFSNILLKIFCIYVHETFRSLFSFYAICFWFWFSGDDGLIEHVRHIPFCFCIMKEIVENWYNFFLKCLVEFIDEHIWD